MKTPSAPNSSSPLGKLRPWIVPLLFLVTVFVIFGREFDPDALRDELGRGDVEAALQRLSTTPREQLPADISQTRWWPLGARELYRKTLMEAVASDPAESFDYPTIAWPLDSFRHAPTTIRLREPATKALSLDIQNQDLDLPVAQLAIAVGQQEIQPGVSWIPGTAFVMTLSEVASGEMKAIARFELLPTPRAEAHGRAMRTAHDLAPDEASGRLLSGLVALHLGLHAEAQSIFETLAKPKTGEQEAAEGSLELQRIAQELRAIALAEQGLDRTALAALIEAQSASGQR